MKYPSEEYRKFTQGRRAAGKLIDPATAVMIWHWAQVLDPYGVLEDLPEDAYCIGRAYFVRGPSSDTWVEIGDLPEATRQEVRRLQDAGYYDKDEFVL